MQVDVSDLSKNAKRLIITVDPTEVDAAISSAYAKVAQRVKVAGFRQGKAPRSMVLRTYGEDQFYDYAMDEGIRRWYPRALDEVHILPIDQGEVASHGEHIRLVPGEPFVFEATVPIKPEIELPDYGAIQIPAPDTTVTEKDVDALVDELRTSRSTFEAAPNKAAGVGDQLHMNLHGTLDGEDVFSSEDLSYTLLTDEDEADSDLPGLSKELIGSRRGDIKEVLLTLPDSYRQESMAGRTVKLNIVVKEVRRRVLPDLTDEFAAELTSGGTVAELRDRIRHNLQHEKHDEATAKVATEVLDSLIARTELELPDALVTDEQDRLVRDQIRYFERQGIRLEQVLMAMRKTEQEWRDEMRPAAERRVKRDLLLDAVASAEKVEPDPELVERELVEMSEAVAKSDHDKERLEASETLRRNLSREMRRRMALERLVESSSGLTALVHEHDHEVGTVPRPNREADSVTEN